MSAQAQTLVTDHEMDSASYSEKYCTATSPSTQTCIVSFLLKAAFYDYNSMTLTGDGALLLQLGDGASGRKERILRTIHTATTKPMSRALKSESVAEVQVKAHEFPVVRNDTGSSAAASSWGSVTAAAVGLVVASFMSFGPFGCLS